MIENTLPVRNYYIFNFQTIKINKSFNTFNLQFKIEITNNNITSAQQMACNCFQAEDVPIRQKYNYLTTQNRKPPKSAPVALKIFKNLGLRDSILKKFVFRKKQSKYKFIKQKQKSMKCNMLFCLQDGCQIVNLEGYEVKTYILQKQNTSIPLIHLKIAEASRKFITPTIIYSHGNSSDLADSFRFIKKLIRTFYLQLNIIIYDYTGYGVSQITETTQQSLCDDLDYIIKWSKIPTQEIVLWGFSLGSYPTINIGSMYYFGGVILHSPLASAACFLDKQHTQQLNQKYHYTYDIDCLDNLSKVGEIRGQILIMHSKQDQIIPLSHAYKLYNIIKKQKKASKLSMIQVSNLRHNQMHFYIADVKPNPVNEQFRAFINQIKGKINQMQQQKMFEKMKCESKFFLFQSHPKTPLKQNKLNQKGISESKQSNKQKQKKKIIKIVAPQKADQDWRIYEQQQNINIVLQPVFCKGELQTKNHKLYFAMKNYLKDPIDTTNKGEQDDKLQQKMQKQRNSQ